MLAPEEMEDFRHAARASLGGLCNIVRKVRTRQPNGSFVDVATTVATRVPCRKGSTNQTPQERSILQNTILTSKGVSVFLFDSANQIYKDDVIVYLGKNYGVIGVLDRTDGEYDRVMVYDDSAPAVQA